MILLTCYSINSTATTIVLVYAQWCVNGVSNVH